MPDQVQNINIEPPKEPPSITSSLTLLLSSATRISLFMVILVICIGPFVGAISEDTFKTIAAIIVSSFFAMKSASNDAINGK